MTDPIEQAKAALRLFANLADSTPSDVPYRQAAEALAALEALPAVPPDREALAREARKIADHWLLPHDPETADYMAEEIIESLVAAAMSTDQWSEGYHQGIDAGARVIASATKADRARIVALESDVAAIMAERDRLRAELAAEREACAQVAHTTGVYSDSFLGGEIPDEVRVRNETCWLIRDKIRARAALSPVPATETSADAGERSRRKFQAEHQTAPATEGGER